MNFKREIETTDSTRNSPRKGVRRRRFAVRRNAGRDLAARDLPETFLPNSPYMFGVPELFGAAAALLLLVVAVASYFYLLAPARQELAALESEKTRAQKLLQSSADGSARQASAAEIINSLRRFEAENLLTQTEGQTRAIIELNEITRRNGVSKPGFEFTPLQAVDATSAAATRATTRGGNLQTVYPGIGVQLSVEGGYANVRRLIRDIEASPQFVIINTVELENANNASSLVSLRLNMAAYFRPLPIANAGTSTPASNTSNAPVVSQ